MKKFPGKSGRGARGRGGRSPRAPERIEVLYEDDAVVALNKPAGLPAVPIPRSDAESAWSVLAAELKRRKQRAYVVHRIDRFTSGILLFAKTEQDRDVLVGQFLEHSPVREYLAVVRGIPTESEGTLVHYFRKEGMHQVLTSKRDREGARAELRYRVEQRLRGAALVRVELLTGLQNQIRVQFAAIGHPVIGDRKYNPEEAQEKRIARVALHAGHLEFYHPRTGENVAVDCEMPGDMRGLVRGLGR